MNDEGLNCPTPRTLSQNERINNLEMNLALTREMLAKLEAECRRLALFVGFQEQGGPDKSYNSCR